MDRLSLYWKNATADAVGDAHGVSDRDLKQIASRIKDLITPKIKKTIVNVISNGGETAETAGQFILFRDLLQQKLGKKYADNILATTDPKGGTLRQIAKSEEYR